MSGRIVRVRALGSRGAHLVSGGELKAALGLRDDRVWINENRQVTGPIRRRYDALGCAPGLPTSASNRVPGGSRQSFARGAIYRNAGAGLTVWLRGSVHDGYLRSGGARGALGLPTSGIQNLTGPGCGPRATCSRVDFSRGRVYAKGRLGGHAVYGPMLSFYLAHGGAAGSLGFPKTDLRRLARGSHTMTFEHGTVTCANGSCRAS